jgi:FecR protein
VYDVAAPEKTEIKLTLHYGVVREISGKGAQAARDHYRMNTPVAALGVRGTDFSVFTDANVTRATVLSGGIIMTPLGQGCATTGVGPCEGASAALLFADQRNALLQADRGSPRSVLIQAKTSQLMPDQTAQASKSEDSAARAAITPPTVQPGVAPVVPLFDPAPSGPSDPTSQPVAPVTPPAVTPEAMQIFWGHYTSVADAASTLASLQAQGSDLVGQLSTYDMTRTPQTTMVMPTTGKFSFQLQQGPGLSEAFLVDAAGNRTQAAISGASLSVDFGAHTFSTSLTLSAKGTSYNITGQGGVSQQDGKLYSALASPAAIRGALAGSNATQAGYVFSETFNSTTKAVGATLWRQ